MNIKLVLVFAFLFFGISHNAFAQNDELLSYQVIRNDNWQININNKKGS